MQLGPATIASPLYEAHALGRRATSCRPRHKHDVLLLKGQTLCHCRGWAIRERGAVLACVPLPLKI